MTLATVEDLEDRLGRTLTDAEAARVEALLDDVSASVQTYTGQKFERASYQVRARVKRRRVRLGQSPVHEVSSVTDRFGVEVAFTWDGLDIVHIDTGSFPGCPPVQVVDITYDAGPEVVPPTIIGVVCSIALRTLGTDPLEGAVRSESIDGYSYTLGSASGAGAYGLLPDEKRTLDGFRRPFGTIRAAW